MDFPTDLEYIVSLGYSAQAARNALKISCGDRQGAILILRKANINGKIGEDDSAWREELPGDWQSGVVHDLPKHGDTRGLWKSPIYASVPSFRTNDRNEVEYEIRVVLKDGRKWTLDRTYPHFSDLKSSLPLGTCKDFTNWFPQASIWPLTRAQLETRRQQLESWLIELQLCEHAMKNKTIVDNLYSFLKAYEHGGGGYLSPVQQSVAAAASSGELSSSGSATRGAADAAGSGSNTPHISILDIKPLDPLVLPPLPGSLQARLLPLPVGELVRKCPFTLAIKDLPLLSASITELSTFKKDGSDKQLAKDYSRDRAVIQGRRLEGSRLDIQFLIQSCVDIIYELCKTRGCEPASRSSIEVFSKHALQQLSRTESAFISFSAMAEIVAACEDTFVVPESSLAEPVILNFRIMDKPESKSPSKARDKAGVLPWCLVCEGQASSVYRVCDAIKMTTHLQLKVVYTKTMYGMVKPSSATGASIGGSSSAPSTPCTPSTSATTAATTPATTAATTAATTTATATTAPIPETSTVTAAPCIKGGEKAAESLEDIIASVEAMESPSAYPSTPPLAVPEASTATATATAISAAERTPRSTLHLIDVNSKDGSSSVSIVRETHTTSRDWDV